MASCRSSSISAVSSARLTTARSVLTARSSRTGGSLRLASVADGGAAAEVAPAAALAGPSPRAQAGPSVVGLRPLGSTDDLPAPSGLRTYPRAPIALSLVDSVVFGRDIDNSGDSYFSEDFCAMFQNRAGQASWNAADLSQGLRTYSHGHSDSGLIQQVVFGHGQDRPPGQPPPIDERVRSMFSDCAGRPSWAASPNRCVKMASPPERGLIRCGDFEEPRFACVAEPPEESLEGSVQLSETSSSPSRRQPHSARRSSRSKRSLASNGQSLVLHSARSP